MSVFPGSVEAAAIEDSLAAHAATVLAVGSNDLGKAGRRLVAAIRDQHLAHAAALRTTDPTDPNTADPTTKPASGGTPTPSPSTSHSAKKPGFAKAVDQLLAAESKAAVAHRASALTTEGLASLLWGSLAVSATHLAAILRGADLAGDSPDPTVATVAAVRARAPMPLVPVVEAEQEMVRQLHAIVYGYQLALGRLTGARRDTAAAELRRHRILRDRLTARLLNRKAEVPVAAAAYVPSTNPRNAATAAKLIRQMETALVPFCGLWLAACRRPRRADRGPGSAGSDPRGGPPVERVAAGLARLAAGLTFAGHAIRLSCRAPSAPRSKALSSRWKALPDPDLGWRSWSVPLRRPDPPAARCRRSVWLMPTPRRAPAAAWRPGHDRRAERHPAAPGALRAAAAGRARPQSSSAAGSRGSRPPPVWPSEESGSR